MNNREIVFVSCYTDIAYNIKASTSSYYIICEKVNNYYGT